MGLLNTITFDGQALSDFGVYLGGDGAFNSPMRIGEMVHIPGRNGSLWLDEGCFENIEVEYPAFIGTTSEADFRTKLMETRSWLASRRGYRRLEDTYHPDEYRLAVFKAAVETDPTQYTRAGSFSIKFDCKPQRFLLSGEEPQTFSGDSAIDNPTLFESKPLIKVTGNGTVQISPYAFTVSDNTDEIWIDSEIMEVYVFTDNIQDWEDESGVLIRDENNNIIQFNNGDIAVGAGDKVSFDNHLYPLIGPGRVAVRAGSGMTVTIYPRWWRL